MLEKLIDIILWGLSLFLIVFGIIVLAQINNNAPTFEINISILIGLIAITNGLYIIFNSIKGMTKRQSSKTE
ncbi:MAG: hypothetical protein FWE36_00440 [Erysipelotrichales bacterium]|nr:hypothetical protein [Erysipelotrichales bacterium]